MTNALLMTALFACGGADSPAEPPTPAPELAPAAPAPATTPAPADPLPPPAPAKGGPLVLLPGNYLPEELKLGAGEAVQVLCKDRLLSARVDLLPVGEGRLHPTVEACPNYQVLFRGLADRMGSGSIRPGIGRGPFSHVKPRDWEAAHQKGVLTTTEWGTERGYIVFLEAEGAEPVELVRMEKSPGTAGLNWIGDLDDDNVPDLVLNTPHNTKEAHVRLFLSAKSPTRQPEQVADFRFTLW